MSANRYDIVLDSISLRVERSAENAYTRGWERAMLSDYTIPVSTRPIVSSRSDRRTTHQTSWADGAAWWKPMLSDETSAMYNDATNMNAFTNPGLIVPSNEGTAITTSLLPSGRFIRRGANIFGIGTTKVYDGSHYDVYRWTPASVDWVRQAGYSCGNSGSVIRSVVFEPNQNYFYVMSDTHVSRFKDNGTVSNDWIAFGSSPSLPGDGLGIQNGRILMLYRGKIYEISTSDGTYEVVSNDAMGLDMLTNLETSPVSQVGLANDFCLFDAGADGVYWLKNHQENGNPRCWLYRADRDETGTDIVTPLASLPPGTIGLNLMLHLGSVIITATSDVYLLFANDTSKGFPRIDVYHYTQGALGILGTFDRSISGASESPLRIMGADGQYLYFGSHDRIWVYDAKGGGIHPYLEPTALTTGVYRDFSVAERPVTGQSFIIGGNGKSIRYSSARLDPKTVANFGDDLTTYTLTSNYFDFQHPLESKTLAEVVIQSELMTSNQKWYVYVSIDDGSWQLAATHTGAITVSETSLASSGFTGRRFRYKLVFETKAEEAPGIMAIQFSAHTGYMLPVWRILFDGGSARNAEGAPIRPEDVYDSFEATAVKATPVTMLDYFRSSEGDDYSTHSVVIESVHIRKNTPGEAKIEVVLRGV